MKLYNIVDVGYLTHEAIRNTLRILAMKFAPSWSCVLDTQSDKRFWRFDVIVFFPVFLKFKPLPVRFLDQLLDNLVQVLGNLCTVIADIADAPYLFFFNFPLFCKHNFFHDKGSDRFQADVLSCELLASDAQNANVLGNRLSRHQ